MRFLCDHHRAQLTTSAETAERGWNTFMAEGSAAHCQQNFIRALRCFGAATELAGWLVDSNAVMAGRHNVVDMWALASHNLFATLCALGELAAAERVVRNQHSQMLALCLENRWQRQMRVAALANLDTSLFTLTSHLGQLGKVTELYQWIAQTEQVAEQTARQLFH